jgi:hypothetical protein
MQWLYFLLAALHLVAVVVTGILWVIVDTDKASNLRSHTRDIRAVHFGSLYLVPTFLGLAYAFDYLKVPAWHQLFFPGGLFLLVSFSSVGYVYPRPPDVNPFYYWTKGPAMAWVIIGMICAAAGLFWTAGVLTVYAAGRIAW